MARHTDDAEYILRYVVLLKISSSVRIHDDLLVYTLIALDWCFFRLLMVVDFDCFPSVSLGFGRTMVLKEMTQFEYK